MVSAHVRVLFATLLVTQCALANRAVASDETPVKITDVIVTSTHGDGIHGTLLDLGPESLTLLVKHQPSPVQIPLADITRIDTATDARRDGVIKGALTFAILCMVGCAETSKDGGEYWARVFVSALTGGFVGWGLDALVSSPVTIYQNPRVTGITTRRAVTVARVRW